MLIRRRKTNSFKINILIVWILLDITRFQKKNLTIFVLEKLGFSWLLPVRHILQLSTGEVEAVQQLMTSWERRGYERGMTEGLSEGMAQGLSQGLTRGLAQGERQGQVKLLLHQVKARFGSIPPELENKFRSMPSEKLLFLSTKLLHASTLEEFKQACLS
ncbi:MAG TPA: DUF4351 domain-containing protein [Bacillota bacterium]|nr:DUF4351 domain-containing protein [Bacillota bacterium]